MMTVLFATNREARPFLALVGAESVEAQPFVVYKSLAYPRLRIAISRMGKVAAATACQAMILRHGATHIVNPGACGALRDAPELTVGSIVRISEASEGDHEIFGKRVAPVPCGSGLGAALPQARLVTNDRPVFDDQRRAECAQFGDVVDMEGAAVARTAALYGVPCDLIKGITDTAQHLERDTLLRNLDAVCERIALFLKDTLFEWENG
jgi:adenosylhomocysteine nucleosidase